MKTFLKVSLKELAGETRIIKHEENKWRGRPLHNSLYRHRMDIVKTHLRSKHLAYGFLRGRAYTQMEAFCKSLPNWNEVSEVVAKFRNPMNTTEQGILQQFAEWRDQAPVEARDPFQLSAVMTEYQARRTAKRSARKVKQAEHLAKIRAMSTEEFAAYRDAKIAAHCK